MRILVPRAVRPVGRARTAGAAIFVAAPRALGPVEIAVIATEPSLAKAGVQGSLGTAIVARYRPIIAAPLAVPIAFAIARARQFVAPGSTIVALAEATALIEPARFIPVALAAVAIPAAPSTEVPTIAAGMAAEAPFAL